MQSTYKRLVSGMLALSIAAPLGSATGMGLEWGVYPPVEDSADFFEAVRTGNLEVVEELVRSRPELLDAGDADGRSAFVVAYLHGQQTIAEALLHYGYQTDLVDAAMIPDWDRVGVFLNEGIAHLNEYHPVGGTALYAAARMGRPQIWRLQARGADVNANPLGAEGVTAAFGVVECPDPLDAYLTAVSLFSNGADVNAPQRGGWSVLHAAVDRDHLDLVRYLIRVGAAVDARDAKGETPLDVAKRRGHAALVELLKHHDQIPRNYMDLRLARNAKGEPFVVPDSTDVRRGQIERLCRAAHTNLLRVRDGLREEPRLARLPSTRGEYAVEAAARSGRHDIVHLLLEAGAPQSLATTLLIGDLELARKMLEAEPKRIFERGSDDVPLMWFAAIGGGNIETAKLLLEFGAKVDDETVGTTALHWAAREGNILVAKFLLEHGANLNAVGYQFSRNGKLPIEVAQTRKNWRMVQFLEEWGTDEE